jgi:hypothetical protein
MGNFFFGFLLGQSNSQLGKFGGIGGALLILFAVVAASMTLFSLLIVPSEILMHVKYLYNARHIDDYDFLPIPPISLLAPFLLWPVYITAYLGNKKQAAISFAILSAITIFICLTHNPEWRGPINSVRDIFLEAFSAIFDVRRSPEIVRSIIYAIFSCFATLLAIVAIRFFTSRLGEEKRTLWLNRLCRPYIWISQSIIASSILLLVFIILAADSLFSYTDLLNMFDIEVINQIAKEAGLTAEQLEKNINAREWEIFSHLAIFIMQTVLAFVLTLNVVRLIKMRISKKRNPAQGRGFQT